MNKNINLVEETNLAVRIKQLPVAIKQVHEELVTPIERDWQSFVNMQTIRMMAGHGKSWWLLLNQGIVNLHMGDDRWTFRVYACEHGFPSRNYTGLVVDTYGRPWLATTDSGLVYFSKGKWRTLQQRDGLPANRINALHMDRQNQLWIVCEKNVFYASIDDTVTGWQPLMRSTDILLNTITTIAVAQDETVFLGTEFGLYVLSNVQEDVIRLTKADGLPSNTITSLVAHNKHAFWVGTLEGVGVFHQGNATKILLGGNAIHDILLETSGEMWLAAPNKLWVIRDEQLISQPLPPYASEIRAFANSDTGVALLFTDKGLWQVEPRRQALSLEAKHQFFGRGVNCLAAAENGRVFAATSAGVGVFQRKKWRRINRKTGLRFPAQNVEQMAITPDQSLWLCSWSYPYGGVRRMVKGRVEVDLGDNRLDSADCLTQDAAGNVWVAHESNLLCLSNDKWQSITVVPNNAELIHALLVSDKNTIICGTSAGLFVKNSSDWQCLIETGEFRTLIRDQSGNVWAGGTTGLYKLQIHEATYSITCVLEEDIWTLCVSVNDTLVVGTSRGLIWLCNSTQQPIEIYDTVVVQSRITALASDPQSSLWVGTNRGVLRLRNYDTYVDRNRLPQHHKMEQ